MKYADIIKKGPEELQKLADRTRVELMKYHAKAATGAPGKDSGKIVKLKRNMARIKMARAASENVAPAEKKVKTEKKIGGNDPK